MNDTKETNKRIDNLLDYMRKSKAVIDGSSVAEEKKTELRNLVLQECITALQRLA